MSLLITTILCTARKSVDCCFYFFKGKWFWERYFNSMGKIALTTLRVLNDRVYRYTAWRYEVSSGMKCNFFVWH